MSQGGISEYKAIIQNGLWKQNPGTVQLLGMCPTLAVTTSALNGLSLGIATAVVMAMSNAAVAPVRRFIPEEIRIPVFILIIAALVTVVDLSMNAYVHKLHNVLGIFIPLIVTNCIVLARVEAFAAKNPTVPSMLDGFMMGMGLAMVLTLLGAMRELAGKGTIFSNLDLVFGPQAKTWIPQLIPDYHGFLLAILPPGAFIGLGLLIAGYNVIERRRAAAAAQASAVPAAAH
ncbi:MAG TPA: electron transport complex subunit E [Methylophilaceae bacterium]|nr:electron transport complex subunit E [Methylophilaceae bacterium]